MAKAKPTLRNNEPAHISPKVLRDTVSTDCSGSFQYRPQSWLGFEFKGASTPENKRHSRCHFQLNVGLFNVFFFWFTWAIFTCRCCHQNKPVRCTVQNGPSYITSPYRYEYMSEALLSILNHLVLLRFSCRILSAALSFLWICSLEGGGDLLLLSWIEFSGHRHRWETACTEEG